MNKKGNVFVIVLIVLVFVLIGIGIYYFATRNSEPTEPITKPVIYATIVSHNEDLSPRFDYLDTEEGYLKARDVLLKMAEIVKANDASWSYDPEWRFLEAALKYEKGDVLKNTNNKNLLRYFHEDLGFEIAPHSHEANGYSYADVVYLITQLGVEPANVASGFIAFPTEDANWERFRTPRLGTKYNYSWTAEAIWGAASENHVGDERPKSGLWKPKSANEFFVNDPNANLITIGSCGYVAIETLVDALFISKTAPGDKLYNVGIFFADDFLLEPEKFSFYQQRIEKMNEYAKKGYIQWVTLDELVNIWENEYDSEPNMFDCGVLDSSQISEQQTGNQQAPKNDKCGDGICDNIEKANPSICPADCQ